MLILSRRPGESLVLDGGIRIDILSTDGRTVRVGIEAPGDVRILRAEIVRSVEEETRRAATTSTHWLRTRPAAGDDQSVTPDPPPHDATPPATEGQDARRPR